MASKEKNSDIVDGFSTTTLESEGEKAIKARKTKVTEALLSLGINVAEGSDPPVIAVLGSGGGLRAMIGFLGTLSKLSELNLLDYVTYLGGISGSTWCMSSLYSNENWSDFSYMKDLESHLCKQIKTETKRDMREPCHKLRERFLRATYSLTDLWAYGVIVYILNTMNKEKLSSHRDSCENGKNPYPIYAAVEKEHMCNSDSGAWFEFTPHLCGFPAYKSYIKSEHLGSKFTGGNVLEEEPEKDLTYLQGMWGSAFGDTIRHYIRGLLLKILQQLRSVLYEEVSFLCKACQKVNHILGCDMKVMNEDFCPENAQTFGEVSSYTALQKEKQIPTYDVEVMNEESKDFWPGIAKSLEEALASTRGMSHCEVATPEALETTLGMSHFDVATPDVCKNAELMWKITWCIAHWEWGTTNNFLYQWKNKIPEASAMSNKKQLCLIDAGLEINTPYPLMLAPHRKVDLILSFDFSQGDPFETLTQTAKYCVKHNVPFPEMNIEDKDKLIPSKSCYSFKGDGKTTPCVMHFPQFNTETCEDANKVKEMRANYDTFNFFYEEAKLKDLLNIAKKNVEKNKDHILEKLKQCAERCN